MKHSTVTHKEAEEILSAEIEKVRQWRSEPLTTAEEAEQAKNALRLTMLRAKELLPRAGHIFIGTHDWVLHDCSISYLRRLLCLRNCLKSGRWNDACSDLSSVIHCFHIEDGRILNEIIAALEEFL